MKLLVVEMDFEMDFEMGHVMVSYLGCLLVVGMDFVMVFLLV